MCVTDLDLDLDQQIAEDDRAPERSRPPAGGDAADLGNQTPGVAWG